MKLCDFAAAAEYFEDEANTYATHATLCRDDFLEIVHETGREGQITRSIGGIAIMVSPTVPRGTVHFVHCEVPPTDPKTHGFGCPCAACLPPHPHAVPVPETVKALETMRQKSPKYRRLHQKFARKFPVVERAARR